jgi:hypothetical protein
MLDVDDFTTWSPATWHLLPFDKISFPSDPNVSICTNRSYMALGMIFYYEESIRTSQPRIWDELNFAWRATFHSELHSNVLDRWPEDGPHAFTKDQSTWLAETLRILKRGPGRPARRRVAPPAPRAAFPPTPRTSRDAGGGGGASKRQRDADPVRTTSRFEDTHLIICFDLYSLYCLNAVFTIILFAVYCLLLYGLYRLFTIIIFLG